MSTKDVLYLVSFALELAGIFLVGSPDVFPQAARLSAWLGGTYRRVVDRVRRWIGRPRGQVVRLGFISRTRALGGITLTKSSGATTVAEKVEFLMQRDQEAQRDTNELRQKLEDLEGELPERLASLQSGMEAHVGGALEAAHRAYLPLRLLGVVAFVVGLTCGTYANFLA